MLEPKSEQRVRLLTGDGEGERAEQVEGPMEGRGGTSEALKDSHCGQGWGS